MQSALVAPETEDVEKPKRRTYTAAYKLRVLSEVDRATERGGVGAILRREGLYSSLLAVWRRQREAGELAALAPKKRGPKVQQPDERDRRISELERKFVNAETRARRAEAVVDLPNGVSEILGIQLPESPLEKS